MPITTITTVPSRNAGLTQDVYSAQMESTLNTMKSAVDDINANASQYNVATSTTSTSSVLIGTGSKTFTVPAALGFVIGMTLRIANTSANFMTGEVTSYVGTSLVMNITSVGGSGTLASWNISMAAVGASTAASVSNTPAGNISSTTVQAAINELDTEKLSSAANAVTDTNLSTVATGATTGDSASIPVITFTSKGRVTSVTTAPKIVSGTVINTTSGTSHDFLSIPSWVKRITGTWRSGSHASTSVAIIQIGDSGGIENTGYDATGSVIAGAVATTNQTVGFPLAISLTAAEIYQVTFTLILHNPSTNTWMFNSVGRIAGNTIIGSGSKDLSATLDRIRLTSVAGTDTFDAGSVNILWE